MKSNLKLITAVAASIHLTTAAEVPEPHRLLPDSALAVLTVPDLQVALDASKKSSFGQLFRDPAMRPFLDSLARGFTDSVLDPIQEEIGIDLGEICRLAQGQVTLAVTEGTAFTTPDSPPGFLILVDSKGESAQLTQMLESAFELLRKENTPLERVKIGSATFRTTAGEEVARPYIGQVDSLLVIGTEQRDVEGIVARVDGSDKGALDSNRQFRSDFSRQLNGSQGYGWLHATPLVKFLVERLAEVAPSAPGEPNPADIVEALGITGLQSLTFASRETEKGSEGLLAINIPSSERAGLWSLFTPVNKTAEPPAFVSEDVASFARTRIDLKAGFQTLEKMIGEIAPPVSGMMQFMIAGLGKDKDPNFDFRRDFINQLGDDLIYMADAFDSATLEAMSEQPQTFLVGSPNPEKLIYSLNVLSGMIPGDAAKVSQREYKGQSVLSIEANLPPGIEAPGMTGVHFTEKNGYLAISPMADSIESYIDAEKPNNSLAGSDKFRSAMRSIGASRSGMVSYEDTGLTLAPFLDVLKSDEAFREIIEEVFANISAQAPIGEEFNPEEWIDFSLLPKASEVRKYFPISVSSGAVDDYGFTLKTFSPTPRAIQ